MRIIESPYHEIIYANPDADIERMALAARTCYKSESSGRDSDIKLLERCYNRGHHSVLEHSSLTVKFVCDRGVSHELVRHRLASFSQESTRYCNYSLSKFDKEISCVVPWEIRKTKADVGFDIWRKHCLRSEEDYFALLTLGYLPETARSVLPTALKTEIVVTANLREWYHIFHMRDAKDAHPDIRFMMHGLLLDIWDMYPFMFEKLMRVRNSEFVDDFVER